MTFRITVRRQYYWTWIDMKYYDAFLCHLDLSLKITQWLNIKTIQLIFQFTRSNKIFKNGWEIKHYYDDSPWSKIPQRVLDKIKTGNITNKPIEVKNVNTGEVLIFNTCRDAVRYFNNGSATKIWYRLKVNNTRPSKDGYLYKYL